jgi:hypothetical protein
MGGVLNRADARTMVCTMVKADLHDGADRRAQ